MGRIDIESKTGASLFPVRWVFLPHVPLYVTEVWFDMYPYETLQMPPVLENDRSDTPKFSWYNHWDALEPRLKWLKEAKQWQPLVRSYLAAISFVDQPVGRIIEALHNNGLSDDTVIVLWSDHGYHLGEKQISGKNTLWERSTRVPFFMTGPGILKNVSYDTPVELLDIYPTLNELCHLPEKEELEGQSLVPILRDRKTERFIPAITTKNYNNHSIRTEEWRYIRYANGSEGLYDMEKDPNEWNNLANDSKFKTVKADLARWIPKKTICRI